MKQEFENRNGNQSPRIKRLEYKCFYIYLIEAFTGSNYDFGEKTQRINIKVRHKDTEQLVLTEDGRSKFKLDPNLNYCEEDVLKLAVENFNLDTEFEIGTVDKLDFEISSYELYIKRKSKNVFSYPQLIIEFKTKKGNGKVFFQYVFPFFEVKKDNFCLSFNIGVGSYLLKDLSENEFFKIAKNNFQLDLTKEEINDYIIAEIESREKLKLKNTHLISKL